MHSYRGRNLQNATDGHHIRRKLDWRIESLADDMGQTTSDFFLPPSIALGRSLLQRMSPERTRPPSPARPSVLLSAVRRSESGCWGKLGVNHCITGVGSSDQNALHCASRKSLSLHHSLQESRHITRAGKNSPSSLSSSCIITLHFIGTLIGWHEVVLLTNGPDHHITLFSSGQ